MPTAKPRYRGDGAGSKTREFSDELRQTLRTCHRDDEFPAHVLSEARWALEQLHWDQYSSTKQEITAELQELLVASNSLRDKLRTLSPNVDRLLVFAPDSQGCANRDAGPLECADTLDKFVAYINAAVTRSKSLPRSKKPYDKGHDIAVELAIRVLRILSDYGIAPAATSSDTTGPSAAIKILKAIGDDIGLVRAEVTWRAIVCEAKQQIAPK